MTPKYLHPYCEGRTCPYNIGTLWHPQKLVNAPKPKITVHRHHRCRHRHRRHPSPRVLRRAVPAAASLKRNRPGGPPNTRAARRQIVACTTMTTAGWPRRRARTAGEATRGCWLENRGVRAGGEGRRSRRGGTGSSDGGRSNRGTAATWSKSTPSPTSCQYAPLSTRPSGRAACHEVHWRLCLEYTCGILFGVEQ